MNQKEVADLKRRLTSHPSREGPFHGIVYHGTTRPFERFDPRFIGTRVDEGLLGRGFYFSTDPAIGRTDPFLITAEITLERPLRIEFPAWTSSKSRLVPGALGIPDLSSPDLSAALVDAGYDGVVLDYAPVGYHQKEIMVLRPAAIEILEVEERELG